MNRKIAHANTLWQKSVNHKRWNRSWGSGGPSKRCLCANAFAIFVGTPIIELHHASLILFCSCLPPSAKRFLKSSHIRTCEVIREIKIHVYGTRQTANGSWEFLKIENKQIKTVQNDSFGKNWHKSTYFCVEAINSKRKIRDKLGHVVQIHVCRLA